MTLHELGTFYENIFFSIGISSFGSSLFVFIFSIFIHLKRQKELRDRTRIEEQFRPILTQTLYEATFTSVQIRTKRDTFLVMELWCQFHQTIKGPAKSSLNQWATQMGLDRFARKQLHVFHLYHRLAALNFLSHLGDKQDWAFFEKQLSDSNSVISLIACRALLKIDPQKALLLIEAHRRTRHDWSKARIDALLQEDMR